MSDINKAAHCQNHAILMLNAANNCDIECPFCRIEALEKKLSAERKYAQGNYAAFMDTTERAEKLSKTIAALENAAQELLDATGYSTWEKLFKALAVGKIRSMSRMQAVLKGEDDNIDQGAPSA